jgi:hypothetical protein
VTGSSAAALWPWLWLPVLGAYHGLNPAMGWLFAVARGLQERTRWAVIGALVPIALGHAASVAAVLAMVGLVQMVLPVAVLHRLAAGVLFTFAAIKIRTSRHPRWVGMRVGFRDLSLWSFLMATAHGAGLMLVPVVLQNPALQCRLAAGARPLYTVPAGEITATAGPWLLLTTGIHTLSLLLVAGAVALLVYEKAGLALLRQAWINLDLIWAGALLLAGVTALVM